MSILRTSIAIASALFIAATTLLVPAHAADETEGPIYGAPISSDAGVNPFHAEREGPGDGAN